MPQVRQFAVSKFAVSTLAALLLAGCARGPEQTVEKLVSALQAGDKVAFEEQLDLERVVGPYESTANKFREEMLKPLFNTQKLREDDPGSAWTRVSIAVAGVGQDSVEYRGIAASQVNASSATVGLSLYVSDLDTTLVHELELEKRDGVWKVVGLGDFSIIRKKMWDLRNPRLEAANDSIRARMEKHVGVGPVEREIRYEQHGLVTLPALWVVVPVTNRGTQPVTGLELKAEFAQVVAHEVGAIVNRQAPQELQFEVPETLAPGRTRRLERRIDLNWDNQAFKVGRTSTRLDQVVVLSGARPDTLSRFRDYDHYVEQRTLTRRGKQP
jgi:hypothetical protein